MTNLGASLEEIGTTIDAMLRRRSKLSLKRSTMEGVCQCLCTIVRFSFGRPLNLNRSGDDRDELLGRPFILGRSLSSDIGIPSDLHDMFLEARERCK